MTTLGKTTQDEIKIAVVETSGHPARRLAAQVGAFLWHLAQMILVMEAGMIVYHKLIWPLLAPTGFATLTKAFPLFGYWMMVVSMTLPMIALMRLYHKSTWGYSLGMTTAMLAPLGALTVLVLCSVFPIHTLYGVGDPVMFVAMAAFILVRPHQHANAGHQHSGSLENETARQAAHEMNAENQEENPCRTA